MRAVYRVWSTVSGPSGEDARLHHDARKSGAGARPSSGPVAAARRPEGPPAGSAQHSGHHHHHHHHSNKDHHHHEAHAQQLQEGRPRESGSVNSRSLFDDLLSVFFFYFSFTCFLIRSSFLFSCCRLPLQPSINTTNIDTLLVATDQTERIVEPPENVQEKIAFIFNNLSQSNMTQKVRRLESNGNF